MNVTTDQIKAFLEVSRKGSFSEAAKHLKLTQAALSIRVKKLEDELERALIIRGRDGLNLSEAGKNFLLFAETYEGLEKEYLGQLKVETKKLTGSLKVGCYSTIGRSLILPSLTNLLSENEDVEFSLLIKETNELYDLLQSGEVDFIFLDHELKRDNLIQKLLGYEEYVQVCGKNKKNMDVFLNHDENDLTSYKYFEYLGRPVENLKRRYLDEIYSVLDGVANDIGTSILPIHLAKADKRITILNPSKKLKCPVYICYKKRSYYTKLFEKALKEMEKGLKQVLT